VLVQPDAQDISSEAMVTEAVNIFLNGMQIDED
jgi:hypothetical protein